jgi:hypothetical protein
MSSDLSDAVEIVKTLEEILPRLEGDLQVIRSRVPENLASQIWRLKDALTFLPASALRFLSDSTDPTASSLSPEHAQQIELSHRYLMKHVRNAITEHFATLNDKLITQKNTLLESPSPAETPRGQTFRQLRTQFEQLTSEIDSHIMKLSQDIFGLQNQTDSSISSRQLTGIQDSLLEQDRSLGEVAVDIHRLPSLLIAKQFSKPAISQPPEISPRLKFTTPTVDYSSEQQALDECLIEWSDERNALTQSVLELDMSFDQIESATSRLEQSLAKAQQKLSASSELNTETLTRTKAADEQIRQQLKALADGNCHADVEKVNEEVTSTIELLSREVAELKEQVDNVTLSLQTKFQF